MVSARFDGAIFVMRRCRRYASTHTTELGLRLSGTDDKSRGRSRGAASASRRTLADRHDRAAAHAASLDGATLLAQAGVPAAQKTTRPSIADPFIPFILETLKAYPKLCASRLHVMVRERGYRGGSDHFRAIVARFRPGGASLIALAHPRRRTSPMRLGALRDNHHRQGESAPDGLRDGAVVLAALVPAIY